MKQRGTRRRLIVGVSATAALALVTVILIATIVRPRIHDPFNRATTGLPAATRGEVVELQAGDTFDLRAGMVQKTIDDATVNWKPST